jgi:hypothetical protein
LLISPLDLVCLFVHLFVPLHWSCAVMTTYRNRTRVSEVKDPLKRLCFPWLSEQPGLPWLCVLLAALVTCKASIKLVLVLSVCEGPFPEAKVMRSWGVAFDRCLPLWLLTHVPLSRCVCCLHTGTKNLDNPFGMMQPLCSCCGQHLTDCLFASCCFQVAPSQELPAPWTAITQR